MSPKIVVSLAVATFAVVGCASDETPDEPTEPTPMEDTVVVPTVDDGIDTNVEQSENLGFDEPDEG